MVGDAVGRQVGERLVVGGIDEEGVDEGYLVDGIAADEVDLTCEGDALMDGISTASVGIAHQLGLLLVHQDTVDDPKGGVVSLHCEIAYSRPVEGVGVERGDAQGEGERRHVDATLEEVVLQLMNLSRDGHLREFFLVLEHRAQIVEGGEIAQLREGGNLVGGGSIVAHCRGEIRGCYSHQFTEHDSAVVIAKCLIAEGLGIVVLKFDAWLETIDNLHSCDETGVLEGTVQVAASIFKGLQQFQFRVHVYCRSIKRPCGSSWLIQHDIFHLQQVVVGSGVYRQREQLAVIAVGKRTEHGEPSFCRYPLIFICPQGAIGEGSHRLGILKLNLVYFCRTEIALREIALAERTLLVGQSVFGIAGKHQDAL